MPNIIPSPDTTPILELDERPYPEKEIGISLIEFLNIGNLTAEHYLAEILELIDLQDEQAVKDTVNLIHSGAIKTIEELKSYIAVLKRSKDSKYRIEQIIK